MPVLQHASFGSWLWHFRWVLQREVFLSVCVLLKSAYMDQASQGGLLNSGCSTECLPMHAVLWDAECSLRCCVR